MRQYCIYCGKEMQLHTRRCAYCASVIRRVRRTGSKQYIFSYVMMLLIPFLGPLCCLAVNALLSEGEQYDKGKNSLMIAGTVIFLAQLAAFYFVGLRLLGW